MRALSCISIARAELERVEERRSHTERWCRWVLSAQKEASCSPSAPSHTSGTRSESISSTYLHGGDEVDRADVNFECPLEYVAADDKRIALLEQQQQQLETRVRALSPPHRPISASVWSAMIQIAEQEKHQHQNQQFGSEDQYKMEFVESVRRAVRRVDVRLGQQGFVRALEEQEHRQQQQLIEQSAEKDVRIRYGTASSGVSAKGGGAGGREPEGVFSTCPGTAVPSGRGVIRGNARKELEEARRVHAEILGELLVSFEGFMPFEVRHGKGHR